VAESRVEHLEARVGELLVRQDQGRDLRDLARYATDPVAFCVEVLHGQPWSVQREIMTAVRDHALVAVAGCNAAGKDWVLAALALWWAYAKGGLVLLTAARQMQAVEILMRKEVARAFTAGQLPGVLGVEALRHLDGRAAILTAVSNEASRLGGHHDEHVFVGITEMSGVEAWALEALLGCAMGAEDRVVAVGNPFASADTFRRMFRPDSPWKTFNVSALSHPNITATEPPIPGGPTAAGIERLARELGTGSGAYAARVLGQFPAANPEALIPLDWVLAAQDRWKAARPASAGETIFAVDVARYGAAETCVCIRRGDRVESFEVWGDTDLMDSVRRIVQLGQRWGVVPPWQPGQPRTGYVKARGMIIVDTVGLGAGLADRLRELKFRTIEFNGGAKADRTLSDTVEFQNARAAAYFSIRDALQAGRLQLPPDELLVDELTSIRHRDTPVGRVALEDKADLVARLNRSCDRADALSMSCAAAEAAAEARVFREVAEWSRVHAAW
jgi:hypothetical protein